MVFNLFPGISDTLFVGSHDFVECGQVRRIGGSGGGRYVGGDLFGGMRAGSPRGRRWRTSPRTGPGTVNADQVVGGSTITAPSAMSLSPTRGDASVKHRGESGNKGREAARSTAYFVPVHNFLSGTWCGSRPNRLSL
ncbi:hypothetical protein GCM10018780_02870 [Streptomyces lanatus]|nr:hypothetical protein GCM10018780_02870 [Streptomyces lanatus]